MEEPEVGQPFRAAAVVGQAESEGDAPPPSIAPVTVPLRSRRQQRALAVQKIQHLVPASGLLFAGMQALGEGARGGELGLAIIEIVTSAALIASFLREVRAIRRPHPAAHVRRGVDWFEIFSAGVLFVEALEKWHLKHHIARPTILLATVTLVMGLLHARIGPAIARHRVLHVDEHGIRVGGKFWRTFAAPWAAIAAITVSAGTAEIRRRDGKIRRLRLDDLHDAPAARSALLAARDHLGALQSVPPPVDIRPKVS